MRRGGDGVGLGWEWGGVGMGRRGDGVGLGWGWGGGGRGGVAMGGREGGKGSQNPRAKEGTLSGSFDADRSESIRQSVRIDSAIGPTRFGNRSESIRQSVRIDSAVGPNRFGNRRDAIWPVRFDATGFDDSQRLFRLDGTIDPIQRRGMINLLQRLVRIMRAMTLSVPFEGAVGRIRRRDEALRSAPSAAP